MGDNYDEKSSGIVCVVSRQAGAVAGKSVVVSKKFVGCGVKVLTGAKDWLRLPSRILVPEKNSTTSQASRASALESRDEQEMGRKKAAKALIAALESDLAAAQRDLSKARRNAEKTHSELASQLVELKAEKKSLISDLEKAKSIANEASFREGEVKMRVTALEADLTTAQRQLTEPPKKKKLDVVSTEEKVESVIKQTVAQPVEELKVKAKKQSSPKAVKAEMPAPATVTDEEVRAAVFANATDKIIFMRAFSDIASQDATVRVDAAKTMAGVRHELSVKCLSAQMACESSAQVRQECVKALAALGMAEALPAVEQALTDEAGSVRLAAVWGLYHLAGAESVPALIHMFADEDEEVRRRAATCIGWLGKEELAVELLPLLDDDSVSVRRAAAEAMGKLHSRQVVSSLIERLNDPVESVRKVVLAAIETITAKKMSKSFPKNQKEFEHLIVRWQEWWKEELLG